MIASLTPWVEAQELENALEEESEEQMLLLIREYRIRGASHLPQIDVESAVYPYLGPARTLEDVESARASLEAAYADAGLSTVVVEVPPQRPRRGVIVLKVSEMPVGRLRVRDAAYHDLERIKSRAQSMAEGKVLNFSEVSDDIVALNRWPGRTVTPELKPGVLPGTVDVDLLIEEEFPLSGTVELNNRYSADTTELRLNMSATYQNLWQLGHTAGFAWQVSPEDPNETNVLSGFYIARFSGQENFSLLFQGTLQDSNVSTLGGAAVVGRGNILGVRAIFTLPSREGFFHSSNFGFDYKGFDQKIMIGEDETMTPIQYVPFSASYGATWVADHYVSEINASVIWGLRGVGSNEFQFDDNRFRASGNFAYLKLDASHLQKLPADFQAYASFQSQWSERPLVNSEQFAGGGQDSVRGYLEAEALGDSGITGTFELRSPSLLSWIQGEGNEWRLYGFVDFGRLTINEALPEQQSTFDLASVGFGTTLRLFNRINGIIDFARPLSPLANTSTGDWRVLFRLSAEF
ncbi:MAG: ShlB/FhaC/HecB family hemolysin secretion/activation protein [Verrucomicrobiales bacterium]